MTKIAMKFATVAALAVMAAASAAVAFPLEVDLHNNAWRVAVEPETSAEVAPYSSVKVTVHSADQLHRMLSNIENLNLLSSWPEGAGMYVQIPGFETDAPVAAETAVTAEAARAAAAAAQAQADAEAAAAAAAQQTQAAAESAAVEAAALAATQVTETAASPTPAPAGKHKR